MFRRERPQKGRTRQVCAAVVSSGAPHRCDSFPQFHQVGAELFGPTDPDADAEMVRMAADALAAIGVLPDTQVRADRCLALGADWVGRCSCW
jgi:histidyl-tRNA synthetase